MSFPFPIEGHQTPTPSEQPLIVLEPSPEATLEAKLRRDAETYNSLVIELQAAYGADLDSPQQLLSSISELMSSCRKANIDHDKVAYNLQQFLEQQRNLSGNLVAHYEVGNGEDWLDLTSYADNSPVHAALSTVVSGVISWVKEVFGEQNLNSILPEA